MGNKAQRKRFLLTNLRIDKLAAVDKPAQEGAIAILRKRTDDEDVEKAEFSDDERRNLADAGNALPDGSYPIRNRSDLKNAIAAFGRAKNKAPVARHIARRAKALNLTDMLPSEGDLADMLSRKRDDSGGTADMADKDKGGTDAGADAIARKLEELEKRLARSEAFGRLTDVEKAHHDKLGTDAEKDAFIAADSNGRSLAIAKAACSTKVVVYKADDGTEYTSEDDTRIVKMAQDRDKDRRELAAERAGRHRDTLLKRASTELGHLPGSDDVKVEVLKAIDSISDKAIRDGAKALLKAGNDTLAKADQMFGTSSGGGLTDETNPERKLESLAKSAFDEARKRGEKDATYEKSYVDVLATDEGRKLYAAVRDTQTAGR